MKKSTYMILFMAGMVVGAILILLRPYTGYMDADYYYAGAKTLYNGGGFQDYYLWNYLGNPDSLPIPSHTYWMPMASLLAWLGMVVCRSSELWAARLPFVLLFALTPLLVVQLSWNIYQSRKWAVISGVFVLAGGYFLKFVTEPDGFCILFLLGVAMIYLLRWQPGRRFSIRAVLLGVAAGLIHLTRADGIIWVLLFILFVFYAPGQNTPKPNEKWIHSVYVLVGYLVITAVWYGRNLSTFGKLLPEGGVKAIFLTQYDQLFSYPPQALDITNWISNGGLGFLQPRIQAMGINLLSVLAVFGMIVLFPSILAGIVGVIQKPVTRFLVFAFGCIFLVFTFGVPLVGMRGGLLHSGAVFMPAIWLIIPPGSHILVQKIRSLPRYTEFSENFFHYSLLGIAILVSIFVVCSDLYQEPSLSQANTWQQYQQADAWLDEKVGTEERTVMVNNPPAYYAATGDQAIVIPYSQEGDDRVILAAAEKFDASYLLLDQNYRQIFPQLFVPAKNSGVGFTFLGVFQGLMVYRLGDQP